MRRAQTEIIGLIVIVILITLVLFFILSFDIQKEETKPSPTKVSDAKITGPLGATMLETTTECKWSLRELLADCAYTREITCGQKNSCEYANETIEGIMGKTLDQTGIEYKLSIRSTSTEITSLSTDGCRENSGNFQTISTPFSTNYGTMRFDLVICE